MDPNIFEAAKVIYNERLQEAEYRQYLKRVGAPVENESHSLWAELNHFLADLGDKLKSGIHPKQKPPLFHTK